MTTATADIAACLPKELKEAFEKHYAKQKDITWASGEYCSRCGARVASFMLDTHKLWHKNASCQLWMISRFPVEHMRQHQEEGRAIADLIGGLLGFIEEPSEVVPVEESYHTHEDGTTHAH